MTDETESRRFREIVLPHLDAAYNLARWLAKSDDDAKDIVQEAVLRSFRSFAGFRGSDGRPWLLAIVRNACYTWLNQHRDARQNVSYDEDIHGEPHDLQTADDPESIVAAAQDRRLFDAALDRLPTEFREAVILRDVEDLSYREIAMIAAIPIGTVMSRLARGRRLLLGHLATLREGGRNGM